MLKPQARGMLGHSMEPTFLEFMNIIDPNARAFKQEG
jgi:hypothetical protein